MQHVCFSDELQKRRVFPPDCAWQGKVQSYNSVADQTALIFSYDPIDSGGNLPVFYTF